MGRYAIHYRGELVEGRDPERVADSLADLFRIDRARARRIVAASDHDLRSDLEHDEAERYRIHLMAIGMRVELVDRGESIPPLPPDMDKMGTPSAASSTADGRGAVELPFRFTGRGWDYFRIWIVNIVLTLLTLGIYSAWAKVRTERYFYGHTILDGSAFEYLAKPLSILKGRLLALLLLLLYLSLGNLMPVLQPLLLLVVLIMLPWLIVRSLAFRYANSSWRNICFAFDGGYREAARVYLLWPLAGLLSLGLLLPLALHRQDRFLIENTRFGATRFLFDAEPADYYRMAFGLFLVALFGFLAIGTIGSYAMVYYAEWTGGDFQRHGSPATLFMVIMPVLVALLTYLLLYAFYVVRRSNLRFNGAAIGENRFRSTLGVIHWSAIVVSNWLLIAATLGLFRPWARVREARYRAACLTLLATAPLAELVAGEKARVAAYGEELGEAFDIDVGV